MPHCNDLRDNFFNDETSTMEFNNTVTISSKVNMSSSDDIVTLKFTNHR